MAYTQSTPNATDYVNATQPTIKANFQQLKTTIEQNHTSINNGTHKFCQFENQIATPPSTTAAQIAVFVKNDGAAIPRLYLREPSSGTEQQISGKVTASANGETTILGGIQIKWGTVSLNNGSNTVLTFAGLGLANFTTTCFGITLTPFDSTVLVLPAYQIKAKSTSGFTAYQVTSTAGTIDYFFIALGN